MEHRGEKIQFIEGPGLVIEDEGSGEVVYTVNNGRGMVFAAMTRFGTAYASQPQQALDDAKDLIDRKLMVG